MSEHQYSEATAPVVITYEHSPTIGKIALALSKAQAQITGALKDSSNPFYKSKYADLASVWDACREHLAANELSVIQTLGNSGDDVTVISFLAHSSGEFFRSSVSAKPVKNDPQGLGSAITYLRRYSLAAIVGVAQIDDDAEAAMGRKHEAKKQEEPKPDPEFAALLRSADSLDLLQDLWKSGTEEQRRSCASVKDEMKAKLGG